MNNEYMVNLNEFAEGALAARFNEELQRKIKNIAYPNTEPHKNRTLTIQVQIHGDGSRDVLIIGTTQKISILSCNRALLKIVIET